MRTATPEFDILIRVFSFCDAENDEASLALVLCSLPPSLSCLLFRV